MDVTKRFVSEFCRWAGARGYPKNKRARLSAALWKAINQKLPDKDRHAHLIVRPLVESRGLTCTYDSVDTWLYPNTSGDLICAVLCPPWETGWRGLSRDYDVETIVAGFFHFASQYIARSRMTNVIGAIALAYNRACDFRYGGAQRLTVGSDSPFPTVEFARSIASQRDEYEPAFKHPNNSPRQREFATWVRTLNSLDPYIHRAIYQYWKATALFNSHFWEEAITSLDGVTSVAAQFAQVRLSAGSNPRHSLASLYGLPSIDKHNLALLYELRSDFGAHPSRSKWWDFAEIYDENIDSIRDSSKRLLWRLCNSERKNRVVESHPENWSAWFSDNAMMVLESVWFTRSH